MSLPSDLDHLADGPPLSRQQQFVFVRLHTLTAALQDAETFLAPFLNDQISKVVLRLRGLFDRANKFLEWNDIARADGTVKQIEAGLGELRGLAKGLGMHFVERIFP